MGFRIDGLEDFRSAFQRLRDEGADRMDHELEAHLRETVFPLTQDQVPKNTGELAATGMVERGDGEHEFQIRYGNSAVNDDAMVDYAAAVHEIAEHRHNPPTKIRYVQDPLEESIPALEQRIAGALDDVARG
jgi:hypothetical protein